MRACGILMPVFSLPGPFGIGTLGKEAFAFVDFLAGAKQTYWQILPIGPTGYGDSPYQSFSAFAGNPYFIDYRLLVEQGFLTQAELPAALGQIFTPLAALSFLAFTLLYTPCVAAINAARQELGSWKATAGLIIYQLVIAWIAAFAVYHIGLLFV